MINVLLNVPADLSPLGKAVLLALRELPENYPRAYDSDICVKVRQTRFVLHSPPVAFAKNMLGPDHDAMLNALDELKDKGLLLDHELESQDDAEGHGMINWMGPAPRMRIYKLAA